MRMLGVALALLIAPTLGAPAVAQTPGVPRPFVPTICSGASAAMTQVCLNDGNSQTLPWLRVNPRTHKISHIGDGSPLTVSLPDGSTPPLSTILGKSLVAPLPDTVDAYCSVTTSAGSTAVTLANCVASIGGSAVRIGFATADSSKLITIVGAGPSEGRLVTSIASVTDGSHVNTTSPATRSMSTVPQRVIYGSDEYASLQTIITAARNLGIGSEIKPGTYLVSQGLVCLPNASENTFTRPSTLCQIDDGATLMAGAVMPAVVTYGSIASDYSGDLRNFVIVGGTIDGNFVASDGVDVPFALIGVRSNQTIKNVLTAYAHYGSDAAPQATSGIQDQNNFTIRDMEQIPVLGVTRANPPVVTTSYDIPFTTGRVAAFNNSVGMTQLGQSWFRVTVTGLRTFTLDNTDSRAWPAFTSGSVSMTMPSMVVPEPITAISSASPAIVTTNVHKFADGRQVDIYNVGGLSIDGTYCAKSPTATTFALYASDCTTPVSGAGTYKGGLGIVLSHIDGAVGPNGVYNDHSSDFDTIGAKSYGVLYGVYNNPTAGGFDGKYQGHWYDYPANGQMRAAISAGGDNTIYSAQADCPALWGFRLTAQRNALVGSRVNCAGFAINPDDQTSYVRLESGAQVTVMGGGIKGEAGHAVLQEVSAAGATGTYGTLMSYSRLGLDAVDVTYVQPDSPLSPGFWVRNGSGPAIIQARGTNGSAVYVCDNKNGNVGAYLAAGAGSAIIATTDNACKYTGIAMQINPTGVTVPHALAVTGQAYLSSVPTSCSGQSSGAIIKDTSTTPATLKICP